MSPAQSPAFYAIAGGLFIGFAALYALTVGPTRTNLLWYNFIFDADPLRVIGDALTGQDPVTFERHPLFGILIGTVSRGLGSLGMGQPVWLVCALLSSVGVVAAFVLFHRICRDLTAAALFAVIYGCSSAIWLLSSIPETFALNSALVVALFLIRDGRFADPRDYRRFGTAVVLSAVSLGMAVPNLVYVGLVNAFNAASAVAKWRARIARLALLGLAAAVVFGALGAIQELTGVQHARRTNVLASPLVAAARDPFLQFDRPLSLAYIANTARRFLADNIIAPEARVIVVHTGEGALQMIQFGGERVTYWLAIGIAVAFLIAITARTDAKLVRTHPYTWFASAVIAFNLVFHLYYRANGQPFIFSAHTVAALLVLVALIFAHSTVPHRLLLLGIASVAIVGSNALFVHEVRAALDLPCATRVGNVCTRWPASADSTTYYEGVAEFVSSADYPFELGRAALGMGSPVQSIPMFRQALALDPRHRLAGLYLGYALLRTGRPVEALPYLENALSTDPSNALAKQLVSEARAAIGPRPP